MINTLYRFFVNNGYVFELLLALALFAGWMERRPRFGLRVGAAAALMLAVSMVWSALLDDNGLTQSLRTILFFVLCLWGVVFSFAATPAQAAFYVTAAAAAQHIAYKSALTVLVLMWTLLGVPFTSLFEVVYSALYIVACLACYLLCGRGLQKQGAERFTRAPTLLFLLVGMQLCTNIFQNLLSSYTVGMEVYTIQNLYDIASCTFLLALQYHIAKQENEHQNGEILKHILYQQKEQMQLSKENIELINIKCHDIKNQIATLGSSLPKDELDEMTKAVNIYGSAPQTGNEALDVLLTGKLLQCEKRDILFDCSIDGQSLAFMKPSDIYSLIGNAVDNAIEAVEQIPEAERRCIIVRGHPEKGMFLLHFENYYAESAALEFSDGLPQTTKPDKRYHGFGMKSIRMITEKYSGFLSVKAENGTFTLNVLLPLAA